MSILGVIIIVLVIPDNAKLCCNCQYFCEYFVYDERHQIFSICDAGRCTKVKTRLKCRVVYQKACEWFEQKK